MDKHPSYKHFPAVGAFSHKFSMAPSGETTDRIKKVMGRKNGTDLLYHQAKYGGDHGSSAGCRRKSVMFFVCFLSRFGMTKFEITETLWSSISFKTIMVSLHRGRFVVVHRCSSFPIDPKNFSRRANFYQKLPFLVIFWAVSPHLLSQSGKNLVRTWETLPIQNWLRGYTPFSQNYTKN